MEGDKFVKPRLLPVLERCLNGREIAVWGTPTRRMLRALKGYNFQIRDEVDPKKHYVVAVNEDDQNDFLADEQSELFNEVDDYLVFENEVDALPFEWECHGVSIGRQTYFGNSYVNACMDGDIRSIGRFTSVADTAAVGGTHNLHMTFISDHIEYLLDDKNKTLLYDKYNEIPAADLVIGNDVYIGAGSFINVSKVRNIGDGAIIGSGAVVLEDVPPYAIVMGVPAKIKRYRYSPEMIACLLRVKWWEWSVEEINANADALMSPEIFFDRFKNL